MVAAERPTTPAGRALQPIPAADPGRARASDGKQPRAAPEENRELCQNTCFSTEKSAT